MTALSLAAYCAIALSSAFIALALAIAKCRHPLAWFAIGTVLPWIAPVILMLLPWGEPVGEEP